MCTSLIYTDANNTPYSGRTIELDVGEPYVVGYVPAGQSFRSTAPGSDPVTYTAKHSFIGVAAPDALPTPGEPLDPSVLKASEGLNDAGLRFSMNAYPTTGGDTDTSDTSKAALQATDIGTWLLSQFATVDEAKHGLEEQPVYLPRLPLVGNALFPFHVLLNDSAGDAIVIQWNQGEMCVYDNPVGVLTNAPEFPWHLTNLGNWTHLDNTDHSSATYGSLTVHQPDSGIATALLPSDNTAVGRFVRSVYYTTFAEKAADPDHAMLTLARIMNNFDRPRGATVDLPSAGGAGIAFQGIDKKEGQPSTEYTAITVLSDQTRGHFYVRSYDAFNYSTFDLGRLAVIDSTRLLPLVKLDAMGGDASDTLATTGTA